MIINWVLIIGIFVQVAICEELDIDESVLTAEEEEVRSINLKNKENFFIFFFKIPSSYYIRLQQQPLQPH